MHDQDVVENETLKVWSIDVQTTSISSIMSRSKRNSMIDSISGKHVRADLVKRL